MISTRTGNPDKRSSDLTGWRREAANLPRMLATVHGTKRKKGLPRFHCHWLIGCTASHPEAGGADMAVWPFETNRGACPFSDHGRFDLQVTE